MLAGHGGGVPPVVGRGRGGAPARMGGPADPACAAAPLRLPALRRRDGPVRDPGAAGCTGAPGTQWYSNVRPSLHPKRCSPPSTGKRLAQAEVRSTRHTITQTSPPPLVQPRYAQRTAAAPRRNPWTVPYSAGDPACWGFLGAGHPSADERACVRARSGRSSPLGRRRGSAAGAPAAAGDAAATPVGRWREVAVELALVTVVGPVQQLLLPGLVEQQQTFVQFDLGRVERAQARQQPPPGVRDARGGAALGGVALGPVFEFGRHATKRRARAAPATPADMPGSRDILPACCGTWS